MYGWPSALAVARNRLSCAPMNSASAGVMDVCHPPRASRRAYACREPLRAWMDLTLGEKATSLDGVDEGSFMGASGRIDSTIGPSTLTRKYV